MEEVAADAAAARHLADVGTKLDANRKAINALGEQTRAQFDQVKQALRAGGQALRAT